MKYASAKGVFDILPFVQKEDEKWKESSRWYYLEDVFRKTAEDFGFHEICTPIFEPTDLFVRSAGEESDIVSKQMYTFLDKANRSMTLRPEGTASFVRAFIEHKLYLQPTLHKYYYIGPMFRYERPQEGRYRQFYQFGAEAIGLATPAQDVELIDMNCEIYRRLQLKNLKVEINSIGDLDSRTAYKQALYDYLTPYYSSLSEESQLRFSKNILRILDSKNTKDREILQEAPTLRDCLTPAAKQYFEKVLELLTFIGIEYCIQPKLVRGLDYYNHIVFEVTTNALGAQNALGGGGRYDGLISALGGPDLPAVGFATGIERVLLTMLKQSCPFPTFPHPDLFFIPMGAKATEKAIELISSLRKAHVSCEIDFSGKKIQYGLQLANHLGATYVIVIGEEELAKNQVKIKTMATKETQDLPLTQIVHHFTTFKCTGKADV